MPSENANCTALFVSPMWSAICVEKFVNAYIWPTDTASRNAGTTARQMRLNDSELLI